MKIRGQARLRGLQLKAAAGFVLLLAAACGGQSGAEGGSKPGPGLGWPGPGSTCAEADAEELPFEPSWIEDLANGRHGSTFGWREPGLGEIPDAAGSRPLVLQVTQRSEIQTTLRCGGIARFDVDVELRFPEDRRATFKGQVSGSRYGAFLNAKAGIDVAKALALPGPALTGEDGPGYQVIAQFDEDGMRGALYFDAGSTGQCSRATWPADRTCSISERELSSDTAFGDFTFRDALSELNRGFTHQITWNDSSTTSLDITLESSGSPICAGTFVTDRQLDGTQLQRLSLRVIAHVKTDDGRLDTRIPAIASVRVSDHGDVSLIPPDEYTAIESTIRLHARAIGRLVPTDAVDAGDEKRFDVLEIDAAYGPSAVLGTVYLSSLQLEDVPAAFTEADAPARTMENGECLGIRGGEADLMGTFRTP